MIWKKSCSKCQFYKKSASCKCQVPGEQKINLCVFHLSRPTYLNQLHETSSERKLSPKFPGRDPTNFQNFKVARKSVEYAGFYIRGQNQEISNRIVLWQASVADLGERGEGGFGVADSRSLFVIILRHPFLADGPYCFFRIIMMQFILRKS